MIKYNYKILLTCIAFIILFILGVIGLTYAFFVAEIEGNDLATPTVVETSNLRLMFNDTQIISLENALPGASQTKTFTVTNIGNAKAYYDINVKDVVNTFVNGDLVYSLASTNNGGKAIRKPFPTSDGLLIEEIEIEPGITQTYTMTILFKETGENQNENQGAEFSGTLQINATKLISDEVIFGIEETMGEIALTTSKSVNLVGMYYGKVSCESEDETIAECSISQNKMSVLGKEIGTTTVVVRESAKNLEVLYTAVVKDVILELAQASGGVALNKTKSIDILGEGYESVSCETTDETIATCSVSNNKLNITGVSEGEAIITIRETARNKSATYEATVINEVYDFAYTGNYQTFVVPATGEYKLEVYGAQGAMGGSGATVASGKGGYSTGRIQLEKGNTLYVYVGGQGSGRTGGYNGGGNGGTQSGTYYGTSSGGGGATDIRLVSGSWNNTASLNSRIIVAGGGGGLGGSGYYNTSSSTGRKQVKGGTAGAGGGLESTAGSKGEGEYSTGGTGAGIATQSAGGSKGSATSSNYNSGKSDTHYHGGGGGGGGGWYGGGGGGGGSNSNTGLGSDGVAGSFGTGGAGGKGKPSSTGWHYGAGGGGSGGSGYVLTETSYKPSGYNPDPKYYMTNTLLSVGANTGNGRAKITFIQ